MAGNNGQMHNLTTLIKRLEAATSRLEDIAEKAIEPSNVVPATMPAAPSAPVPAPVPSVPKPEIPEVIKDYNDYIATTVKKFVNLSDEIGGAVSQQASIMYKAFAGQKKFLLISTQAKKPSKEQFVMHLTSLQEQIVAMAELKDTNRGSPYFNHLTAMSEGIGALPWVMLEPKPFTHVEEVYGEAQFWGNKILKEYKDKDPKQVEWVQAYYTVFKDLIVYVRENFPHGIVWNPKGLDISEAAKAVDAQDGPPPAPHPRAPAVSGLPPPPPPPPGPPPKLELPDQPKTASSGGLGAVFSDLNKGSAVTSGLKHVSANEMTHKNPSLRAGATVPEGAVVGRGKSPAPGKKPKPESMRTKKPPVKTLEGNKWLIENFDSPDKHIDIKVEMSQSVLITKCNKTVIVLHGKANAISIDNSNRLSLIIDSLVSSVDVIKSQNFQIQVNETLPTVLLDQVDNATIFLGQDSLNTEILTSKCSGINICTLEGDESKETPIPEQIRTYIGSDGKPTSEIVEHSG